MTNEELIVMAQMITEVRDLRQKQIEQQGLLEEQNSRIAKTEREKLELEHVRKTNLDNVKRLRELEAERDDARRRLKDAVLMLEDMWRDYSQINWRTKADKERAADMAAKIKAWCGAKDFVMVQTDKGEWVAK